MGSWLDLSLANGKHECLCFQFNLFEMEGSKSRQGSLIILKINTGYYERPMKDVFLLFRLPSHILQHPQWLQCI